MKLLICTQIVDKGDDNLGFFHQWVEEFARQCDSVIVVCLFEGTHALPANVRVLSLGKPADGGPASGLLRLTLRLKYVLRFYSYIRQEKEKYDTVFVHMNQIYVILGGLFWRLTGKRVGLWYAHRKVSWTLCQAALLADVVFTSTKEGFRIPVKKCHIVGQGIDQSLFAQKQNYAISGPMRLVTAGRITPVKHIEQMIEAVAALAERGIPATLDVIGSGDVAYTQTLAAHAREKGIAQRIVFLGGMPYAELARILASYDAFINLQKTVLDKALLDAATAGLPVVATNPSFFGAPARDPAAAVERLYRSAPEERRRQAIEAHAWVAEHHSLATLIARMLSLL